MLLCSVFVCGSFFFSSSVCFLSGGPVERAGSEEETGNPSGEHIKPHELLQQNMDSKTLSLCVQAVNLYQPQPWCFTVF